MFWSQDETQKPVHGNANNSQSYYRKKDAEKAVPEAINHLDKEDFIETSNQTFKQYAIDWIEGKKQCARNHLSDLSINFEQAYYPGHWQHEIG